MITANQWGDLERISEEFTPITLKTEENTYWKDYEYGWPIQKLRPWIEVAWSTWWSSLYASISWWLLSILNNTTTTITGLSTKIWDTAMTATADQITITQSWFYLINAFCYWGWSANLTNFRLLLNGSNIAPHIRLWTSTAWVVTPSITTMLSLVAWDVLTLTIYQNSGSTQVLQTPSLSVVKI